jgi:predicted nucleotidyltransferase
MTSGDSTQAPDPALVAGLRAALPREPRLRLAVLFGSAARGALRPDSDVDVGIVPYDANLTLAAELDLQTRLSAACGREAEIVRLDRATTLLRWQAALHGVPLLSDPPTEWSRFQARAAIEHAELRVVRDPAAERFRERLARGTVEAPGHR